MVLFSRLHLSLFGQVIGRWARLHGLVTLLPFVQYELSHPKLELVGLVVLPSTSKAP